MEATQQEIIAGLDIGTTKICVVIGKRSVNGVEIIGVGHSPSHGVRQGMVVNLDVTSSAIRKAVREAELTAGCEVNNVIVGIADKYILGQNSLGVVSVKGGEVKEHDISRVIESARTIPLSANREILHIIPKEFIIGDQHDISQPLGMTCSRLEVKAHIVSAATTSVRNIVKACDLAGLHPSGIILQSLASAEAVLMPEERELGVVLIDIGGGTTDIAVFGNSALQDTFELPVAGNHLTNDLSIGMRLLRNDAELLKCTHGCCLKSMVDKYQKTEISSSGGRVKRVIQVSEVAHILQARSDELFSLVARELRRSEYDMELAAGLVITGGSSQLPGMLELAEQMFDLPVRLGKPINIGGLGDKVGKPMYSTGVGLVLYGFRTGIASKSFRGDEKTGIVNRAQSIFRRIWKEFV